METGIGGGVIGSAEWNELLNVQPTDIATYSPLVLAYIGDGIYELIVRTKIVCAGNIQVNKMHKKSSGLVRAITQAEIAKRLEPDFTPEEMAVFKRGRNAKSASSAKNASVIDYRVATGLETLFGYLYLTGNMKRLVELIHLGLERIGETI